jgi:hypothetical protein
MPCLILVFHNFSYIPAFKAAVPAATPRSIQTLPLHHINHQSKLKVAVLHKKTRKKRPLYTLESTPKFFLYQNCFTQYALWERNKRVSGGDAFHKVKTEKEFCY